MIVQDLKQHITNYFRENISEEVSQATVWDAMKEVLGGKSSLSILGGGNRNRKLHTLKDKIRALEQNHKITCSKQIYKQLLAKRKILEALDNSKLQRDLMFMKQRLWKKIPLCTKIISLASEGGKTFKIYSCPQKQCRSDFDRVGQNS